VVHYMWLLNSNSNHYLYNNHYSNPNPKLLLNPIPS
jgi:hypothetical protein